MHHKFSDSFDSPINKFEQMLKTNSIYFFDVEEFEVIIHYYIDSGEINLARKALKLAFNQHSKNIQLILLKCELLIIDGELEKALKIIEDVEYLDPNNQEIFIQKATIFSKKTMHNEAIKVLEESLTYSQEPFEIWSLLGMEYMMQNDYNNAQIYLIKCINKDPEDYQIFYNLIYCLDQLKDHEKSINLLNHLLELNPYNEIAWHELGKQYVNINKVKEAITAFDFAIISEEQFTGAYIEKGKLLEKTGKINEAIENYEITLKLEDPSSYVFLRIGACHKKIGNNQLAINYFKKAISSDPSNSKAWDSLINFFIKTKKVEKAILYLEKVLKINDDNLLYWKKLASLYKKIKKFKNAEKAYKKVIDLGDTEYQTWIDWIDSLLILNNWKKAYQIAEKAKRFFPSNYLIDYRLAACFLKIGKPFKAKIYIENFYKNESTPPTSINFLFPEFSSQTKK